MSVIERHLAAAFLAIAVPATALAQTQPVAAPNGQQAAPTAPRQGPAKAFVFTGENAKQRARMLELVLAEQINDNFDVYVKTRTLSRNEFVGLLGNTASSQALGEYYDLMKPWGDTFTALLKKGGTDSTQAEMQNFMQQTATLTAAYKAIPGLFQNPAVVKRDADIDIDNEGFLAVYKGMIEITQLGFLPMIDPRYANTPDETKLQENNILGEYLATISVPNNLMAMQRAGSDNGLLTGPFQKALAGLVGIQKTADPLFYQSMEKISPESARDLNGFVKDIFDAAQAGHDYALQHGLLSPVQKQSYSLGPVQFEHNYDFRALGPVRPQPSAGRPNI